VLEIRPALPSEYGVIGDLTASTYLAEGFAGPDYAEKLRDVTSRASQTTVLVALLEGQVVGSVTVVTGGGPYAENTEPGTAVLRMLVTGIGSRGAGVGTALVEAAVAEACRAGCSVVRLSTQATMTAAHRVYERLGFCRTPERDWSPEPDVNLLTYARTLTYCGQCGEPGTHPACERKLALEPPRYCTSCRRRMVVQVTPTGWKARCVEHGLRTS
jgi:ribosomal protein S18 acetylase RimI-like enzyme